MLRTRILAMADMTPIERMRDHAIKLAQVARGLTGEAKERQEARAGVAQRLYEDMQADAELAQRLQQEMQAKGDQEKEGTE